MISEDWTCKGNGHWDVMEKDDRLMKDYGSRSPTASRIWTVPGARVMHSARRLCPVFAWEAT